MKKESVLSQLFAFAGKHKYLTILGMTMSGISALLILCPVIFIWLAIKEIFDVLPHIELAQNITYYGWLAVIFSVASILVYFIALMCTHIAAFRTARNMRSTALHHLVTLPLGYFDVNGSGKLRRIIDDSSGLTESFLAHQLPDLTRAIVTPIAAIILLLVFDWKLGIISLLPIIISVFFLMKMMGPGLSGSIKEYQDALEDMNNEAVEYVRGIPVVKTFGQSIFSFKKFHASIERYKKWAVNYSLKLRIPNTEYTVCINAVSVFLAVGGALLVGTVADYKGFMLNLIFYILFTPICVTMMNKIMWTSENTMIAKDAVNRINSILSVKPLKDGKVTYAPKDYSVKFNNVSFSYPGSKKTAVNKVSFDVSQGSTVALVGPSGGGKTTIASLIPRFWDVDGGKILIGGINVKDIPTNILMDKVSFVFQNSKLFKASLLDNIREGKPNATEAQVIKALKAARCEDIVEKLPNGINTVVGTKGTYLSGGETQRIALARAILKDSPIVLLDEATAFADPENEYKIQLAFEELTKGKTVLMIAHRLSTIRNADNIIVVDDGKIVESGTHESLVSKKGIYKNMWQQYQSSVVWSVGEGKCVNG